MFSAPSPGESAWHYFKNLDRMVSKNAITEEDKKNTPFKDSYE
jgi:hypothetical protein